MTPATVAGAFFTAAVAGDEKAAARYGTAAAIGEFRELRDEVRRLSLRVCDPIDDVVLCFFAAESDPLRLIMELSLAEGAGWRVDAAYERTAQ